MSFLKKIWKDRQAEHPARRLLTNVSNNDVMMVDVSRAEGEVLSEGDAFDQENMNDLETRIKNAFDDDNESMNALSTRINKTEEQLNDFSFGIREDGKAGYRRGASTEIIPFKTNTSLSVRAEGGKRWCRTTIYVKDGTMTYGGRVYTAGQSIVIEASNPATTQEDVPVDAGWRDMVASN